MLLGVAVVLGVALGLRTWTVPYYAMTPGDATSVGPLIGVRGLATDHHRDKILLTDVYLQQLTAWQWLTMHFQSHVEFLSADQLVEPGVPSDELGAQGFLEMDLSKQAAEVAALRALGWRIPGTANGALVEAVIAPSSARRAGGRVADRIVAVNGAATPSSCAVVRALHDVAPGTVVHLSLARAHIDAKGTITYSSPTPMRLTVGPPVPGGAFDCPGVHGPAKGDIGVVLEDSINYALPGTFSIDTNYIGGPSAGLAMTLSLIDQLSRGSLTGGTVVAATGAITPNGQVTDVGGVAEKTVAVQRAGATVFLVPSVEVATARGAAQPGLRIMGVTTLGQALGDLRRLGGAAPVPLTAPNGR